jgi:hypothetical protein
LATGKVRIGLDEHLSNFLHAGETRNADWRKPCETRLTPCHPRERAYWGSLEVMENVDSVTDLVYLKRRASEERVAASGSPSNAVRNIHLELASAYEFRLHIIQEMARIAPASQTTAAAMPPPPERVGETQAQPPPLMAWNRRP